MSRVVAVIPARYHAVRLPGKPLLEAAGKPLIRWVFEAVKRAAFLDDVVVATDDERIARAVEGFEGRAVRTRADHPSGTDRVCEACRALAPKPDIVINVQGDEPGVDPGELETLVRLLEERPEAAWSTLAVHAGPEAGADPARVKVVTDAAGLALYFSRAPIPHVRDAAPSGYLVHRGLYGFRREALEAFPELPRSPLEAKEGLEQLRVLEAGLRIAVGVVDRAGFSIDTPADFEAFRAQVEGD